MAKLKVRALDSIGDSFDFLSGILGQKMAEDRAYTRQKETERRKQDWYWETLNEKRDYRLQQSNEAFEEYFRLRDAGKLNPITGQPDARTETEAVMSAARLDPNFIQYLPTLTRNATPEVVSSNTMNLIYRDRGTGELIVSKQFNPNASRTVETGWHDIGNGLVGNKFTEINAFGEVLSQVTNAKANPNLALYRRTGGRSGGYKVAELFADMPNYWKTFAVNTAIKYNELTKYDGGTDRTFGQILTGEEGTPTEAYTNIQEGWQTGKVEFVDKVQTAVDQYGSPGVKQVWAGWDNALAKRREEEFSKMSPKEKNKYGIEKAEDIVLDVDVQRDVYANLMAETFGGEMTTADINMANALFFTFTFQDLVPTKDNELDAEYAKYYGDINSMDKLLDPPPEEDPASIGETK